DRPRGRGGNFVEQVAASWPARHSQGTEWGNRMADVDVVVVGAGSAGCVMAARLAESPSRSVLLLEAGPDLRSRPDPAMHDGWRMWREHGWGVESEPDESGVAAPLHRGRLVGGTSWMTRFAMRGSPADFAQGERVGDPGRGC